MAAPRIIRPGDRFGRLTVVGRDDADPKLMHCRCDCGSDRVVKAVYLGRDVNSCGCLRRETAAALKARHGMAATKIYQIWAEMVARCTRPTHARYASYGGRGITVCERWLVFDNFYADMGERPEGRSLDRANNDLGYSPENCRWATASEQARNRRQLAYAGSRRDERTGRYLPGGAG